MTDTSTEPLAAEAPTVAALDGSVKSADGRRLGARIRELREQSGMSLRALAKALDISASALSQIERGTMQPSVNRLIAIVTALGVPLAEVFGDDTDEKTGSVRTPESTGTFVVSRAETSSSPVELDGGVTFRRLSPAHMQGVDFFESVYPPHTFGGAEKELLRHEGYEVGNVTRGRLTIQFADESVELGVGDSITYPCEIAHRISNEHDETAVAVWLIVHPSAQ